MKYFILTLLLLLLCSVLYPFGKNKVAYYTYQWEILETEHYKIYIPDDFSLLSNQLVSMAEDIFIHHAKSFDYTPSSKIRIIVYKNQIDFQQNNIEDWTSPGTGGFTEFIKGRVVVPYSSFYPDFFHVLSHELNHAFQGLVWGKGSINMYSLHDIDIPLWMIEGASEFNSIGVDPESEMIIADALISGILPSLKELTDLSSLGQNSYFYVYKEGQLFYEFIRQKFGDNIYAKLNKSITEDKQLDSIISNTFQMNLQDLNASFFDFLRKKYMPAVSHLDNIEIAAKRIMQNDSFFNMNPVSLPSNKIAFISERKIYPSIIIYDRQKNWMDVAVRGGFDEEYLEFSYGKRNNLSYSSNGLICFVSRSGGEDAIHLYNTINHSVEKLPLNFRVINSPDISPDGGRVVFAAETNQLMQLFLYDRVKNEVIPLLEDAFYNTQPRFLGDSRIVFVSNRRYGLKSKLTDLFIYNIVSRQFETMIGSAIPESSPSVSPDGSKIAFIREGTHPSLEIYDRASNIIYHELETTGGVMTPSFNASNQLFISAFNKNTYNIYEYTPKYERKLSNAIILTNFKEAEKTVFTKTNSASLKDYSPEFSLDNLFGGLMVNTSFGVGAIGLVRFSDFFGDHRFQILMDTMAEYSTNFLNYFNIDLSYLSLQYRHNYGFRIFHYSNYLYEFSTFLDFYDMERPYLSTYGAFGIYHYPLGTFDRLEAEVGYRGFSFATNVQYNGDTVTYDIYNQSRNIINLSYVHDSTLWDITGPVDGLRYEILLSKSFPLFADSINYEKLIADFRYYWMIVPGYGVAVRGVVGKAFDNDTNISPFYIGGFNSVRGHPLWATSGDTMYLLNVEVRVPFIADWILGVPIPIRMPTVWGVLFWDFGSAWNWSDGYQPWVSTPGTFRFKDLLSGLGFGFRVVLFPGVKAMVDLAVPYDGNGIPDISTWQSFWQIGIDF